MAAQQEDFSLVSHLESRELCHCVHQALLLLKWLPGFYLFIMRLSLQSAFFSPLQSLRTAALSGIGTCVSTLVGTGWPRAGLGQWLVNIFICWCLCSRCVLSKLEISHDTEPRGCFSTTEFCFSWHRLHCLLLGCFIPPDP